MHISHNGGMSVLARTLRRYDDNVDITRLVLSLLGYLSTPGTHLVKPNMNPLCKAILSC